MEETLTSSRKVLSRVVGHWGHLSPSQYVPHTRSVISDYISSHSIQTQGNNNAVPILRIRVTFLTVPLTDLLNPAHHTLISSSQHFKGKTQALFPEKKPSNNWPSRWTPSRPAIVQSLLTPTPYTTATEETQKAHHYLTKS